MPNEKTSKTVASKASSILRTGHVLSKQLDDFRASLRKFIRAARTVAASDLTQAPNRRRR